MDQAIIMAGGANEIASLSDVKIYRDSGSPERTILPVDLNAIQAGQTGPQIQASDVIVVERSAFLTFVNTLFGLGRGRRGPACSMIVSEAGAPPGLLNACAEPMMSYTIDRLVAVAKGVLRIGLGFGIVVYLIWSNWGDIARLGGQPIRWGFLVAGLAICLLATLLGFLRWYLLVWAQGLPFRLRDSLRIGFIGYFSNFFIPGAVGGDLVKVALLVREQRRRTAAVATVVIDRLVGLFALILLGGLATVVFWGDVVASPQLRQLAAWTCGLLGMSAVGMLVLFSRRLHQSGVNARVARLPIVGATLSEGLAAIEVYREKRSIALAAVLMGLVSHLGFILTLWCALLAQSDGLPPAHVHFMVAPLGLLAGAIPATPGGLGLAEGAMSSLFAFAGVQGALALLMMLAYRCIQIVIAVVGLLYYLATPRGTRRALRGGRGATRAMPAGIVGG